MCTERGLDRNTTRDFLTRQARQCEVRADEADAKGRPGKAAKLRATADRCHASAERT